MDDRRIPNHGRRTFFAEGPQASLQLFGARACLSRAVATQRDEVSHFPPIAKDRFEASANRRRQRPQDRHGKLGDGLLESSERHPGAFSLGATGHVKPSGRLELLRQAVAAAVGRQQEDVEQRMQVPPWALPSFQGISHLFENGRCEKLPHRVDQRPCPPTGPRPCVGHLPFLHDVVCLFKPTSSLERLYHARALCRPLFPEEQP